MKKHSAINVARRRVRHGFTSQNRNNDTARMSVSLSMSTVDLYSTKSHLLMIDLVVAFVLFIFVFVLLCFFCVAIVSR